MAKRKGRKMSEKRVRLFSGCFMADSNGTGRAVRQEHRGGNTALVFRAKAFTDGRKSGFRCQYSLDILFCLGELVAASLDERLCAFELVAHRVEVEFVAFHFCNDGLEILHGLFVVDVFLHDEIVIQMVLVVLRLTAVRLRPTGWFRVAVGSQWCRLVGSAMRSGGLCLCGV